MRQKTPRQVRVAMGVMVALAAFLAVADFLPHTDDGCAVEVHCLACRAHISAVTDLATLGTPSVAPSLVAIVERRSDQVPLDASLHHRPPGRAPPASA